jgi:hypothetical protein
MKKLTFLLLSGMLVMTSFGCGSSGSSVNPSPTPAAANDNSYKGVYKGVLSGSTGHFYIDAYNTDATKLILSLTFTGVTIASLEGTQTTDSSTGDYIYTFSSDGCVFIFEVTPTGSVVSSGTSLTCTSHSGTITVNADKATSTTDVSVWEGTNTDACGSGVWNMIMKGGIVAGTHVETTNTCTPGQLSTDEITGTVTGNSVNCTADTGTVQVTGTISGTTVSGVCTGGSTSNCKWSGSQTL